MRNCANKMIENGMFNRYVKEGKKSLKGKLMAICMNQLLICSERVLKSNPYTQIEIIV